MSTAVIDGTLVHVSSWYDNEMGYSARCVDLLAYLGSAVEETKPAGIFPAGAGRESARCAGRLQRPLKNGKITDDTTVARVAPDDSYLREKGARVCCSRTWAAERPVRSQVLAQAIVRDLEKLLGAPVEFIPIRRPRPHDATAARAAASRSSKTRGFGREKRKTIPSCEGVAALGDLYVKTPLGRRIAPIRPPRPRAPTQTCRHRLPDGKRADLSRPDARQPQASFVAVLGGAKISGKIDVIRSLLPRVEELLTAGAMACTFFGAWGWRLGLVGGARCIALAKDLLATSGKKLILRAAPSSRHHSSARASIARYRGRDPQGLGRLRHRRKHAARLPARLLRAKTIF